MKLTVTKAFLEEIMGQYSNGRAFCGYAEQSKIIAIPIPKFYVIVLDHTTLTLVQLDLKIQEKAVTVIPIESIEQLDISGLYFKKIVLKTNHQTYKLIIRPYIIGIKEYQRNLISALERIHR
ncbi:hypothetical protein [Marinilactibacillus kalidii]|uniref:hypothetical protein n=1 Tax=Marinilactibacillus kalidii TaxID=2820274 RepID=UPI001ABDE262|nr:hypothetical protein [Marinilactibacillus kalidii]